MEEMWLDDDPMTGTRRVLYRDPHEKTNTIRTFQEVGHIVEDNKRLYNERDGRWRDSFNHVASIPLELYYALKKQHQGEKGWLKAWLNDPDNRAFRTRPGRV